MRAAALIALIGVGLVAVARADEDASLRAAEQELKVARQHLAEAGRRYGGHRQAAVEHVNKALDELRRALASSGAGAPKAKPAHPAPHGNGDQD